MMGKPIAECPVAAETIQTLLECVTGVLESSRPCGLEHQAETLLGPRWFETRVIPELDDAGQAESVILLCRDITDSRQAHEALQTRDGEFARAQALAHVGTWMRDLTTGRTNWSDEMRRIFGLPTDAEGPSVEEMFSYIHPDDALRFREAFDAAVADGKPYEVDMRVVRPDGEMRYVVTRCETIRDESGRVAQLVGSCQDITARRLAEIERHEMAIRVQQSQKFESLGMLAGGIAHEFNNLLVTILGNADLAMRDVPEQASAYESLQDIKQAAIRASELSSQMLDCSGRGTFSIKPVSVNKYVEDVLTLMRSTISTRIEVATSLEPGLPEIAADSAQLTQILTNLLSNAVEAIDERPGTIRISTSLVEIDADALERYVCDDIPPGEYVRLTVADDGCGMDEETRQRAFDPFFSTKFTGRGLGLGSVLGIVRGHRGAIRLTSAPARGSTIEVLLAPAPPAVEGGVPRRSARRDEWRGEGMVLVVDDRSSVLESTRRMLQRLGFVPLTASNGPEAAALFARAPRKVQAAIIDLLMPGMDGYETAAELRKLRDDLPLVLCSGYPPAEHDATASVPGNGPMTFLTKPFDSRELAQCLQKVLA
jgi:PAS domain S-box-containing protein